MIELHFRVFGNGKLEYYSIEKGPLKWHVFEEDYSRSLHVSGIRIGEIELRSPFQDKNGKWLYDGDRVSYCGRIYSISQPAFGYGLWYLGERLNISMIDLDEIEWVGTVHDKEKP